MTRTNRRARTLPTVPVRDNHIYDVAVMVDAHYLPRGGDAFYYRRHLRGVIFTGTLRDAESLPRTARS